MKNRQKLKGSVLFTVVAVMMVVLVFVMSALTIAGATNRRAYSDYAKAQTEYSARSALEATLKYLRTPVDSKNNQLAQQIVNMSPATAPISLDVKFDGGTEASMGKDGTAKVTIKCLDDQYEYLDGEKHAIVAITASVTLAGETSEETMIVLKDPPSSSGKGGSNAVTSLANFISDTSPRVLGGSSANLLGNNNDVTTIWKNSGGSVSGSSVINSNLAIMNKVKIKLNKGEGVSVFGNFGKHNSGNNFNINSDNSKLNFDSFDNNYKTIPYLFVDGTIYFCNYTCNDDGKNWSGNIDEDANSVVAEIGEEGKDSGVNIYCQQIIFRGLHADSNINADIYIFGTDSDSSFKVDNLKEESYYDYANKKCVSVIGAKGSTYTKLLNWAEKVINPSTTSTGGNLLSNGSVKFDGTEAVFNKNVSIKQGACVTGKLNVGENLSVGEYLIINGGEVTCQKLKLRSLDRVIFKSGILEIKSDYSHSAIFKSESGKINVELKGYDSLSETEPKTFDTFKKAYEFVFGGYSDALTSEEISELYPEKMTHDELVGRVKDDKSNDTNNDGIGDNKIANLPVENYGKFLDKKEDGSIYYESDYFKTWKDTTDKNGNTIEGMWRKFYDAETGGNPIVPKYNANEVDKPIDKSCILYGLENNEKIVFDVPKGTEIWVYLEGGFKPQNSKGNIIVKGGGTVNFYTDGNINLMGNSYIATEYYYNKLINSDNILIVQNPTNQQEIPNIYIYCDYKNVNGEMNISNSIITGYIFAPTYKFISGSSKNKAVTYFEKDLQDDEVSDSTYCISQNGSIKVIGSIFVNEFQSANDDIFVYVSDSGMGSGSDGELSSWATLAYTAGDGLGVE